MKSRLIITVSKDETYEYVFNFPVDSLMELVKTSIVSQKGIFVNDDEFIVIVGSEILQKSIIEILKEE